MPEHITVRAADKLMSQLDRRLSALATKRLECWRSEFKAKFPRQHGSITFGMGTESVTIGGKQYNSWNVEKYSVLKPLYAAIEDACLITNQYQLACPDDLEF